MKVCKVLVFAFAVVLAGCANPLSDHGASNPVRPIGGGEKPVVEVDGLSENQVLLPKSLSTMILKGDNIKNVIISQYPNLSTFYEGNLDQLVQMMVLQNLSPLPVDGMISPDTRVYDLMLSFFPEDPLVSVDDAIAVRGGRLVGVKQMVEFASSNLNAAIDGIESFETGLRRVVDVLDAAAKHITALNPVITKVSGLVTNVLDNAVIRMAVNAIPVMNTIVSVLDIGSLLLGGGTAPSDPATMAMLKQMDMKLDLILERLDVISDQINTVEDTLRALGADIVQYELKPLQHLFVTWRQEISTQLAANYTREDIKTTALDYNNQYHAKILDFNFFAKEYQEKLISRLAHYSPASPNPRYIAMKEELAAPIDYQLLLKLRRQVREITKTSNSLIIKADDGVLSYTDKYEIYGVNPNSLLPYSLEMLVMLNNAMQYKFYLRNFLSDSIEDRDVAIASDARYYLDQIVIPLRKQVEASYSILSDEAKKIESRIDSFSEKRSARFAPISHEFIHSSVSSIKTQPYNYDTKILKQLYYPPATVNYRGRDYTFVGRQVRPGSEPRTERSRTIPYNSSPGVLYDKGICPFGSNNYDPTFVVTNVKYLPGTLSVIINNSSLMTTNKLSTTTGIIDDLKYLLVQDYRDRSARLLEFAAYLMSMEITLRSYLVDPLNKL